MEDRFRGGSKAGRRKRRPLQGFSTYAKFFEASIAAGEWNEYVL